MKLLDILFEGLKPKDYTLDDIKSIISNFETYTQFTTDKEYQNVRKSLKKEFGDDWKEKFDEVTKVLRDSDENKRIESIKSQLKDVYKNYPEWNFDNIITTKNRYNATIINGIYCSKHNTYKDNVSLIDLRSGHTTPCNKCGQEKRVIKVKDAQNINLLKGDKNVEKYKNLNDVKKYDDDYLISIAQKYVGKNINLFKQEKPLEYLAMLDRGPEFLNKVSSVFIFRPYPNDYLNVFKKYYENKSYTEFRENNRNVYNYIKGKGPYMTDPNTGEQINTYEFLSEFTKDMIRTGNLSQRIVYAHEFYDGKKPVAVYVGLTYNEEKRYKEHITGKYEEKKQTTPVTKFIKENPKLKHVYKPLTNYVDEIEALKLEDEWERKYKLDGWMVLNVRRIFSLGRKSTKLVLSIDDLRESINSFIKRGLTFNEIKLKYPAIINTIYKNKLQNPPHELFKNIKGYQKQRTIDELIVAVLEYDSVSELRNRDEHLYEISRKRIGVKELHKMYEKKGNDKMK
jgi:hypothetical protein